MPPIQFIVIRQEGKWLVKSRDLERSFCNRSAAAKAAVDLANHSGKNGTPAVVISELAGGRYKTIWSCGRGSPI